jgi:hypothetical protein
MDDEQACSLLREKLDGIYDESSGEELVRALECVPLAITQAAAFINRRAPDMSVAQYLDKFRMSDGKKASLLNRDAGDLRRDERAANSVVTTWQITFEQIRQERPTAAELLSLMSFFNPQGIPEAVLQSYKRGQDEGQGDVEEDFIEDYEVLRAYSLVTRGMTSDVLEMHALVQFCTRKWLSTIERQ